MIKPFAYILVIMLVVGCTRKGSNHLPETYSHKQNIKYSFEHLGKVVLKYTDSVFVGRLISLAVFKDGRLSIGDNLDSKVKIFSHDGEFIKSISRKGSGPGETQLLRYHCIDDSGRVWISDLALHRVSVYDTSGVVQDTWSPEEGCDDCHLVQGEIRVAGHRIYLEITKGIPYPVKVSNISSLVTAYDFNYKPLAAYGKYEQIVEDYHEAYARCAFDADSSGNFYFIHELSHDIWKYLPDGRILKRFDYPVSEYRPLQKERPHRSGLKKVMEWYTIYTSIGHMEIVGKYLFISFANKEPQFADDRELRYWHEYLQVFDLDGNCLVDYLEAPGKFLCKDDGGVFYFLKEDEPERMVISKYKFVVEGE